MNIFHPSHQSTMCLTQGWNLVSFYLIPSIDQPPHPTFLRVFSFCKIYICKTRHIKTDLTSPLMVCNILPYTVAYITIIIYFYLDGIPELL